MKMLYVLTLLFSLLLISPAFCAEDSDPVKDVVIYTKPQSFAEAQQLALQNRADRMAMLEASTACLQQTTTVEGIRACQKIERVTTDKIRLSYCDTDISFLMQNAPSKPTPFAEQTGPTECEKALELLTGRKVTSAADPAQGVAVRPADEAGR